jgi:hypothetical protein
LLRLDNPFPSIRISDDIGKGLISDDKVAEFIIAGVQNLVRFAWLEDDALAFFDGNSGFGATKLPLPLRRMYISHWAEWA